MLYRVPVDTSPVTEGVTLFKHQLLLLLLINKSDSGCAVVRFFITLIITDRSGVHSVLLPLLIKNYNKISV